MKRLTQPAAIGAFVLGALILAVSGLFFFGAGRWLEPTLPAVVFFKGSVAGLDIGAPVELRGVKVGVVRDIQLHYDVTDQSIVLPVLIDLDPRLLILDDATSERAVEEDLAASIRAGLQAQLIVQSFVTGKLKVALDLEPGSAPPPIEYYRGRMVLPSRPGRFDQFAQQVQDLPLQEIVRDVHRTMSQIATLLASEDLAGALRNLNHTLAAAAQTGARLKDLPVEQLVGDLSALAATLKTQLEPGRLDAALAQFERTAAALEQALREGQRLGAPLRVELSRTLEEVGETARSLRRLANSLEAHPEALLRGKP